SLGRGGRRSAGSRTGTVHADRRGSQLASVGHVRTSAQRVYPFRHGPRRGRWHRCRLPRPGFRLPATPFGQPPTSAPAECVYAVNVYGPPCKPWRKRGSVNAAPLPDTGSCSALRRRVVRPGILGPVHAVAALSWVERVNRPAPEVPMQAHQTTHLLRQVRCWLAVQALDALADPELLERFRREHNEAAFAALLERHGPLVLRVCGRLLDDGHAVEDA